MSKNLFIIANAIMSINTNMNINEKYEYNEYNMNITKNNLGFSNLPLCSVYYESL